MRIHRSHFKGFTLIESVAIMVIIGLIAAAAIPRLVKTIKKETFVEGKQVVRSVREEIIGFAISNCSLPSQGDLNFLVHQSGRWKGEIEYAPAYPLTKPGLNGLGYATLLEVEDSDMTVTVNGQLIDNVAFVVASKGEDHTNNTKYINNPDIVIPSAEPGVFDDLVDYVLLSYLKEVTRSNCQGSESPDPDPDPEDGASNYVYTSGGALDITNRGDVTGNVNSRSDVTLYNQATVNGDVSSGGSVYIDNHGTIDGDVVSNGTVTIQNHGTITGDINAQGDVILDNHAIVQGSISTTGRVVLLNQAQVLGGINSTGDVSLGSSYSYVGGDVITYGDINLGHRATINGEAHAGGDISLGWRSNIVGDAYAQGTISGSGSVGGTPYPGSSVPPRRVPTPPKEYVPYKEPRQTSFTSGGMNISSSSYITHPLPPGKYGSLSITSGNDGLKLTAGTYYFDSIYGYWDWNLQLDLSGGDIQVFVTGAVNLEGSSDGENIFVSSDGSNYQNMDDVNQNLAAKMYLETHDSYRIGTRGQWFGTVYSSGAIQFSNRNKVIGSLYTPESVSTTDRIELIYVQSNYAAANW